MSGPRSAAGWADEQRALRERAAVPGFAPPTVSVTYRVVDHGDRELPPGTGGLLPRVALLGVAGAVMLVESAGVVRYVLVGVGFVLIARWFWPGAETGTSLHLSTADVGTDGVPSLVVRVADGAVAGLPPSGAARAFGDLVPGGVLGVVVGGVTVWPSWPPRAGTGRDA